MQNSAIDLFCGIGGLAKGLSSIKSTFESHGICIRTDSENSRPDILGSIKKNCNNLAHGLVSFVDAVRDDSIQDFEIYQVAVGRTN